MLSDSDPDTDLLNFETRKWSLSEKINSSQLYSADLVKFLDSKGNNLKSNTAYNRANQSVFGFRIIFFNIGIIVVF
jgi:hypothetical protein